MTTQIIDWDRKGNVVRFYLGTNGAQWGDDWNDAPYEHNAGRVYAEFEKGRVDVSFAFGDIVREPCEGHTNSPWAKEDFVARRCPCLVVLPAAHTEGVYRDDFDQLLGNEHAVKFYFGDEAPAP